MLKTVKEFPANGDEVIKFFTYYGASLSEAEDRSNAAVNAIFQNWVSSIQSVKHTEDFALNAFNTSCIVIESNVNYRATVDLRVIDLWFLIYLVAGMIVFFSAKTWSRNTNLHLGTGVSVGVLASILILLYILSRFLPSKFKSLCYVLMAMGTSASLWALQSVSDTMVAKLVPYWHYVLGYVVTMGLLSAAVVYRYGKISDTRTLNLIQWLLQCIGLVLIYNGTQIREVSVALIIVTLTVYNFPRLWIARCFNNQSSRNLWYRLFPPKIRLLTEEEYNQQGNIHTRAELEKLRDYCRSPDCKAWKVISRLNSPHKFADFIANGAWHVSEQEANRFADFIEGNSWHVTNDELLEYDSGPDPIPPHMVSDDDDDDDNLSEADFMLSSP